jgi:hypothetical protein
MGLRLLAEKASAEAAGLKAPAALEARETDARLFLDLAAKCQRLARAAR